MSRLLGRVLQGLGLFGLVAVLVVAVGLFFAERWLPVLDQPRQADRIVVLAGSFARAMYAADLFNRGLAPGVLVSRPQRDRKARMLDSLGVAFPREEDITLAVLERKGVPRERIELFGQNNLSTVQEAMVLDVRYGDTATRLLIVTSPYHVRRTRHVFSDRLRCPFQVVGTPYEPFPARWWESRDSAMALMSECIKWGFHVAGGRYLAGETPEPELDIPPLSLPERTSPERP